MKINKEILVLLALIIAICGVFAACSSEKESEPAPPEEGEEITLDTAKIKNADCIALIKSYEPSELGLDGTWEDYDFVAHRSDGVYLTDKQYKGYYVCVEVGTKNFNDDGTFSVDTAGVFYISYDGETLLSYDQESGEYTRIKNVHDIPEVTLPAESTTAGTTAAADTED